MDVLLTSVTTDLDDVVDSTDESDHEKVEKSSCSTGAKEEKVTCNSSGHEDNIVGCTTILEPALSFVMVMAGDVTEVTCKSDEDPESAHHAHIEDLSGTSIGASLSCMPTAVDCDVMSG